MSGVAWFDWLTAAAFAVLAVVSLARLVSPRRDAAGRADAAAHGAMAVGMAAMALPAGTPLPSVPTGAWIAVFVVVGAWALAALARSPEARGPTVRGPGPPPAGAASGRRLARVGAAHHVAASALMIVLLAAGHSHPHDGRPADGGGTNGHAGHHDQAAGSSSDAAADTPGHAGHAAHAGAALAAGTDGHGDQRHAGRGLAAGTDGHADGTDARGDETGPPAASGWTAGRGTGEATDEAGTVSVPRPPLVVAGAGFLAYGGWLALGLVRSTQLAATGCACVVRARRVDAACAAAMSAGMALMAFTMA